MNKSEIAGKYTTDPEVKLVLAQILDKMEKTRQKNILTMTGF